MKKLLKKKIVLIPLLLIISYLVVVIIYYLQFSSDASAFCDKKFRPRRRRGGGDRDITPEQIDAILFNGAAEKGYSVKTVKTGASCPTCTDGVPSEIHIVTPDGYKEWISEAPITSTAAATTARQDMINEVVEEYKDRIKRAKAECKNEVPSFFSTTFFTLGMVQYISKVGGGGTYVFAPEFFWFTPAMYMSMLP